MIDACYGMQAGYGCRICLTQTRTLHLTRTQTLTPLICQAMVAESDEKMELIKIDAKNAKVILYILKFRLITLRVIA